MEEGVKFAAHIGQYLTRAVHRNDAWIGPALRVRKICRSGGPPASIHASLRPSRSVCALTLQ